MSSSSAPAVFSRAHDHALSYSSAGNEPLFDPNYEIDKAGFLRSLYRAGGPQLRSLPAPTGMLRVDSETSEARRALIRDVHKLEADTIQILKTHGVSYKDVNLVGRRSKIDPEEEGPIPTMIVDLERKPDNQEDWLVIAQEIHAHIATLHAGVPVELIDPSKEELPLCSPIQETDSIWGKWPSIRDKILSTVMIFDWTGLEIWRYGRDSDPLKNPITIIATIQEDSSREFAADTKRIWSICAEHDEREVSILFMKDEMQRWCDVPRFDVPQLPVEACVAAAQPGVSLGIHKSSAGSSTLGGALELRFPCESGWTRYYTTCFHCVCPGLPDHRENLLSNAGAEEGFSRCERSTAGLYDSDIQPVLRIDHPSNRDLTEAAEIEKSELDTIKTAKFLKIESKVIALAAGEDESLTSAEKRLYDDKVEDLEIVEDRLRRYEDFYSSSSNVLGEVVAGSGQWHVTERPIDGGQTQGLGIMDWALISVPPERHGPNKPFPYPGAIDLPFRLGPTSLVPDTVLFKSGRSSQITEGRYSGVLQARIFQRPDRHGQWAPVVTYEHAISSPGKRPFAEPGDSGAWIYTGNRKVVGMLVGSSGRLNVSYFIHIEDIMRDVKMVTNALDVRIAGDDW